MSEPENLSELFGPSAASTATGVNTLAGRLPGRRTSAVDTVSAPASSPAAPASSPAAVAPAVQQHQADQAPKAHAEEPISVDVDADDLPAQISVYVLPAVVTTVRRTRKGRTNAQIAFQAITALRDQLPKLVASHRTSATKPAAAVGPFAPQSSDRGTSGPRRVLWTFKATGRNQKILDQIVKEAGAASRSELVAAALEAHLLKRRRRP